MKPRLVSTEALMFVDKISSGQLLIEICTPRPWIRGRTGNRCRLSLELIYMCIIS